MAGTEACGLPKRRRCWLVRKYVEPVALNVGDDLVPLLTRDDFITKPAEPLVVWFPNNVEDVSCVRAEPQIAGANATLDSLVTKDASQIDRRCKWRMCRRTPAKVY